MAMEEPVDVPASGATNPSPSSADEIVEVVDLQNQVIGRTSRREVRTKNLLHRGVGILCKSSGGEIYVHRRTTTKDVFPGMYDMLVGGVVRAGEEYDAAARREIREELGIDGPDLVFLFHHLYLGPLNRSWVAVYEVTWDGPIRHQETEVAWGKYSTLEEILEKLGEWEWVPDGLEIFEHYRRHAGL